MRFVVLIFLAFILFSLFSALYYVWKDRGTKSNRAVKALTVRVALSILLFALLMLSYRFGFITHKL
jgi:Na+/H+ antiporter NhaC